MVVDYLACGVRVRYSFNKRRFIAADGSNHAELSSHSQWKSLAGEIIGQFLCAISGAAEKSIRREFG